MTKKKFGIAVAEGKTKIIHLNLLKQELLQPGKICLDSH